jgi:PAS domain-containing protein
VSSVLLSVVPVIRWGQQIAIKETLARAHTILSQAVRENHRILAKTNENSRLTTEALEVEPGVLSAYIIDPKTNNVLAPAKYFNKTLNDPPSLLAIQRVIEGKEDKISVRKDDVTQIVAQPIYLYSSELNDRKLEAIVIAAFQIQDEINSTFQPMANASLFAVLLSLLAYFFIYKMFTRPLIAMYEQIDTALKGEEATVVCDAKIPELEGLATQINFVISRMKQAPEKAPEGLSIDESEKEDNSFLSTMDEFGKGASDGLLVLDRDNKIQYVGRVLEDLIGLRSQYAKGQNISEASRDSAFAGTIIDLAQNVTSSFGEAQTATLDINGTSRNLVAVGHKDSKGEIRFVLIVIKMSSENA